MYKLSQYETPLFTSLVEHSKKILFNFTFQGIKKGQGMDPEFREFIGQKRIIDRLDQYRAT
ncbi:hypothetical protein GCM10020331_044740 [Ectobacillus funiculus]